MKNTAPKPFYHVTLLSNFLRGYDRYRRVYSKAAIPESTFPDRFFVLRPGDLGIGIAKANKLREKLGIAGDRLIALETALPENGLRSDHPSGRGQYVAGSEIDLKAVYFIEDAGADQAPRLIPARVEDVTAQSYALVGKNLTAWQDLAPRSVSILPIALACQASCRFCFSKASVSSGFSGKIKDWARIEQTLAAAKTAGAGRAVITGGGEPTLLKPEDLSRLVGKCAEHFSKVVLITNGERLAKLPTTEKLQSLRALDAAGLSILALSRHHHDDAANRTIMGIDTASFELTRAIDENRHLFSNLRPRLVCVLQKQGIARVEDIEDYLTAAAKNGVREVNFKELYVAASDESVYSDKAANEFSADNQVPLRIVHDFAARHNWRQTETLPWGAPVFEGVWQGVDMKIAAYTEPSVYWERTNGIARSWNLMSDGSVLASLEDPASKIALPPATQPAASL